MLRKIVIGLGGILLTLALLGFLITFDMLANLILVGLGGYIGLMVFLFVFFSIPGMVQPFIIDPNRHKPRDVDVPGPYPLSRAGLFTTLEPGHVKLRESWYGRFLSALMNWEGKMFEGEPDENPLQPEQHEYWKVVDSKNQTDYANPDGPKKNYPDSHPIPYPEPKGRGISLRWWLWLTHAPFSIVWWVWRRHVYNLTGAVWVGVPGFVTLHIYRLERRKRIVRPGGQVDYVQYVDYSDHYRVNNFQFRVIVEAADTNDLVEVNGTFNQVAHVFNPILVAYNTDLDWPNLMVSANSDALTSFTRPRSYKEVIAASKEPGKAEELTAHMTRVVNAQLVKAGIEVVDTQYIDVSGTDAEVVKQLAAPSLAQANKEARLLQADADAAYLDKTAKILQDNPSAVLIAQIEGNVRTSEAAGKNNAIVFIGGNQGGDPATLALLKEIRDRRPPVTNDNSSPQGASS